MIIDVFIRTYEKDFLLLKYALISITKFVNGYRYINICVREKEYNSLLHFINVNLNNCIDRSLVKIYKTHDFQDNDDYYGQQYTKMNADCYTDAEYIFFTDCDNIFYENINIKDMFFDKNQKIIFPFDKWENVGDAERWKKCLQKLDLLTEFEFMRRLPIIIPSYILKNIRNYIETKCNKNLINAGYDIYNDCGFSEFNIMISYIFLFNTKCGIFIPSSEVLKVTRVPAKQFWSHHHDKNQLIQEIKQLLDM
jgi:hypothetical protein